MKVKCFKSDVEWSLHWEPWSEDEMSPQLQYLKNFIASAKAGNEYAVTLLRQICAKAANEAPVEELISFSEFLLAIGLEHHRGNAERN